MAMVSAEYPSKRDPELLGILLLILGLSLIASLAVVLDVGPDAGGWIGLSPFLLACSLVAWIWLGTGYRFEDGALLARSGPFRWRIPLGEIVEVLPTRSPLASPALSLDRLEVRYGRDGILLDGILLISPEDPERFLRDLMARNPFLRWRGDRLVR